MIVEELTLPIPRAISMFFNMEQKDLAFIKQPITKKKDGTNEPGLISKKDPLNFY